MTDNEIIKALELCNSNFAECPKECPMYTTKFNEKTNCIDENNGIMALALDLINRQKTYIEVLKKRVIVQKYKKIPLGNEVVYRIGWKNAFVEAIKAEAIKEFAERLKNEIISDTAYGCDTNQHSGYYDYQIKIGDIPEYIDNLAKKLSEVSDNA